MPRSIELTELERRKLADAGRKSIACTNGWRPIETAPKDGTPFIGIKVFQNKLAAMAIVKSNSKLPDKMWQCCASVMLFTSGIVDGEETDKALGFLTHWQPLPKPPQEDLE